MLFGTSGIRGIYGKEITESLAGKVSNIFADKDIALGRDMRPSGVSLSDAVESGTLSRGKNIYQLGIVPTPTVALATQKHKCNGIMITASHNPPEYNGLKLIEKGKEISKTREKEIERDYAIGKHFKSEEPGSVFHDSMILDEHKELILSNVDCDAIAKRKPKAIVDCNGAGSVITPYLLKDLGCDVVSLNAEIGTFNRPSEPNDANLSMLKALVPKLGADFGLAHDGDGDRTVVVDEKGNILPFDAQLAMMMEHELKQSNNKSKNIISTMEASLSVRKAVEESGGKIIITPVGSTYVADALEAENALFGGEPCGEYIYKDGVHVPDGPMAAAKLVEIFAHNGKFSVQAKQFKTNPIARERFSSSKKYEVVESLRKEIRVEGKRCEDDGIRIDEEDGWFLIRASGTEPIVRLTMEYESKAKLEKRKEEISKIIMGKIKEKNKL